MVWLLLVFLEGAILEKPTVSILSADVCCKIIACASLLSSPLVLLCPCSPVPWVLFVELLPELLPAESHHPTSINQCPASMAKEDTHLGEV